jgi:hypothetical protein
MSYNGWKNRETWNVALWIGNDRSIYHLARECKDYAQFVTLLREHAKGDIHLQTPDGVAWNDSGLDIVALDEMIRELKS